MNSLHFPAHFRNREHHQQSPAAIAHRVIGNQHSRAARWMLQHDERMLSENCRGQEIYVPWLGVQLVRAPSRCTKFVDLIPSQGTYKNQLMNA